MPRAKARSQSISGDHHVEREASRTDAQRAGFIAALDQSGGSTPKALRLYGVPETAYASEEEMFDLIHEMRARIIKSPPSPAPRWWARSCSKQTMDRKIDGTPTATYLWEKPAASCPS
ncbi:MAG: hypothetical protein R3D53_13470 [Paracoccaceae bacterium]